MDLEDLAQAIRTRDVEGVHAFLFERSGGWDPLTGRTRKKSGDPVVARRARSETELWDYKSDVPDSVGAWAITARHVLAFHNHRGGVLVYGIRDSDYLYCGASRRLDSKLFNDQMRKYLPDTLWVDFTRVVNTDATRYLGFAIVPPRGAQLAYFVADAPQVDGRRDFLKGESALRQGDSSVVLTRSDALAHQASFAPALSSNLYRTDEPFFRVFELETDHFVDRPSLRAAIDQALGDERTSITSLIGVGGSGKTTLATAATIEAFDSARFQFIVSVTAKDRELATEGIRQLTPGLTSYEALLATISDVLGFTDLKHRPLVEQEAGVRDLLTDSGGLVFVDNLETVDDPRVIQFLDDLPVGVKGLVTSRRLRVRVSVRPVDIGSLTEEEAERLVRSLRDVPGLGYVMDMSTAEISKIADACDRLPLAIRWTLLRAESAGEALQRAEKLRLAARQESELLEFTFRRVFEDMSSVEKTVMRTLSVLQDPTSIEGVVAGTGSEGYAVVDSLDGLVADGLVQRTFDSERNTYAYGVAPLTRSFLVTELRESLDEGTAIRRRLVEWYEARDVANPDDRVVVRELRQGRGSPEAALLDIAQAAQRRGEMRTAEQMYSEALERNPASWRAARLRAEFERHVNRDQARALQYYEQAAHNAPSRGSDRAIIFREWGMLLKDSGRSNATEEAIEKFEIALQDTPNDAVLLHALAVMYDRKGAYMRVIELLEPLRKHPARRTRELCLQLLSKAYDRTMDIGKAAQARADLRDLELLRGGS